METKYFDTLEEEIVDYETACERVQDDITWDDLERYFTEGLEDGKYCISEFWNYLPEWMQIDISDDAFNYNFEYRFEEREGEENA